eukprot:scaffold36962_cov343-Isochrysis_galbana.AAC.1
MLSAWHWRGTPRVPSSEGGGLLTIARGPSHSHTPFGACAMRPAGSRVVAHGQSSSSSNEEKKI